MTAAAEPASSALPRSEVGLARAAAALWKRPARAATAIPPVTTSLVSWRPDPQRLADFRELLGSSAPVPIGFPQVPITALQLDLMSSWSFPVRVVGLIHPGFVVEVLDELPADEPWDLRVWVSGGRSDVNPIHLHPATARLLGFRRPIAHGWWTAGRVAARLGIDELLPGRKLEIVFRRPVELPSAPTLCSSTAPGVVTFALLPEPGVGGADEPVRPLAFGRVTGPTGPVTRPDRAARR
ncbi:MAG: MaoC/PaaZ C-terminal domain-containing protein [Candidatus Nanopelagicales bacterium]